MIGKHNESYEGRCKWCLNPSKDNCPKCNGCEKCHVLLPFENVQPYCPSEMIRNSTHNVTRDYASEIKNVLAYYGPMTAFDIYFKMGQQTPDDRPFVTIVFLTCEDMRMANQLRYNSKNKTYEVNRRG